MYLMYIDESGDPGLVNSPTRYFTLSGLVVHELRWSPYLEEIIKFRREMKALFGLKLREEIHAGQMLTKPGELSRIPKHHRLEILRKFADLLGGMPDFSVINIVVDKEGKQEDYDVFEQAWKALFQRFENTLSHKNFPGPSYSDERGMLFPDRTDAKKLRSIIRRLRAYNPVSNQTWAGDGFRNLQIRYLIEDPNHRDSQDSYFIQSADLCAYLFYQSLAPSAYMKKKSGHNYFKRLKPILCKVAATADPMGIVRL